MDKISIFYLDKEAENEKINSLISLAKNKDIAYTIDLANNRMSVCGFEFPTMVYRDRMYGYQDSIKWLSNYQ